MGFAYLELVRASKTPIDGRRVKAVQLGFWPGRRRTSSGRVDPRASWAGGAVGTLLPSLGVPVLACYCCTNCGLFFFSVLFIILPLPYFNCVFSSFILLFWEAVWKVLRNTSTEFPDHSWSSLMAQQVKSLLWLRSLLWYGFTPWPRNFHMLLVRQKTKKN